MTPRILLFVMVICSTIRGATLSGTFTPVNSSSNVDLTLTGKLDWVHWGYGADHAVNRKTSVTPLISDFSIVTLNVTNNPLSIATSYWLGDANGGSCTWQDGDPTAAVTNTFSGVFAYSYPTYGGSGFKLTLPADTTTRTLVLYVGTVGAQGELKATLTGTGGYNPSAVAANVNGYFTINYAANSAGQTLTVTWTLPQLAFSGYVILQAATVTATGVDNPPFAVLNAPTNDAMFMVGTSIPLSATAQDFDGTVTNIAFYANNTLLGQGSTSPFGMSWSNATVGKYHVRAVATDNAGVSRASIPAEVYVYNTNGAQTGAVMIPPAATVDLTTEGKSDWVHWGLSTSASIDRKANVVPQISNFTVIGNASPQAYADNLTSFGWTDGTPTVETNGTKTGVFVYGATNGFALTLPADTTPRTARIYLGNYAARSHFAAYLSDFSAPPFIDTSINDASWNNEYGVYEINYRAASAGQQLKIDYRPESLYDTVYGNVTLQAVTMNVSPSPVLIVGPTHLGSNFALSFGSVAGSIYTVQYSDVLPAIQWTDLTNIPGTGSLLSFTNYSITGSQRYFRVETK